MIPSALALLCLVGSAIGADRNAAGGRLPTESAGPVSPIEAAFGRRAGTPLKLYGYDLFDPRPGKVPPSFGTAQNDYLLGPGDELRITIHGAAYPSSRRYAVDSNGDVVLHHLRPLRAAGRTIADLRRQLEAEVTLSMAGHEAFLSLEGMRRMGIMVTGAVKSPGRHEVSGSGTLLDALLAAGGVDRLGSLRTILLIRGGTSRTVDFYGLLQGLDGSDPALRDGDRIVVPPIGPTVAVAGEVKRPGIYELPPAAQADGAPMSVTDALALAGGPIQPAPVRIVRFALGIDGAEAPDEAIRDPGEPDARPVAAGDLLIVSPARDHRRGTVTITGHVRQPGPRALAEAESLASLIGSVDLLPDPYLPFAALETTDPGSLARVLSPVDLQAVLDGRSDRLLGGDDTLIVLGSSDVGFLSSRPVLDLLRRDGRSRDPAECAGIEVLARRLSGDPKGVLARGPLARAAKDLAPSTMPCPRVFDDHPDLLAFAMEHAVLMRGVLRPGLYPAADRSDLATLSRAAGGGPQGLGVVSNAASRGGSASAAAGAEGGDIVDPVSPRIELAGHAKFPGTRLLSQAPSLRSLLGDSSQALNGLYPLFGVIERYDRRRLTGRLITFSPHEIIQGISDRPLADGDTVRLFSFAEIRSAVASRGVLPGGAGPAGPAPAGAGAVPGETAPPALLTLLADRSVDVRGAVREPGAYPVDGSVGLDLLLSAAGGLNDMADRNSVEITAREPTGDPGSVTSARRVVSLDAANGLAAAVGPGDSVRVDPLFSDREPYAVTIEGEVKRPGSFDVIRGERLSSLLKRAGGLTDQAYPAGAIFARESVRRQQAESFAAIARNIERDISVVLARPDPPPAAQIERARTLSSEFRDAQPIGRITVEADPARLALRPELDIVLEPGDRIFFPKRPLTVTVTGEVLAPASLQFSPAKDADDYIGEAGGMTQYADSSRAFVLKPDGSAQPLKISFWNHEQTTLVPGSTIIVPRDPEPFHFFRFTQNVGGLLSQLAVAAAAVFVLTDR
ncbi:SLBB domain-containing protein [Skermanella mucosa]|uniref:SLBB domain-containing protein n=1 Tax=Skermanella mucosa TaxID=1789672 RepID=UPI00192AB00B|nr:SLBB domain-containing protein [Skermanella mucosa]UEM22953.1 SLBB domain-containing protein [Skermanella mucosa]